MAIFPAVITVIALAVIVASLFAITWRLRRANRVKEPSCPRCFYNVTGLQSPVCPECGADLSQIGVLEPGKVKPLSRVGLIVYSTLFLFSIAWISSPFILHAIPKRWALKGQMTLSQPASGSHVQVVIDGSHTFRRAKNGRAQVLTLTLQRKDGSTSRMEVDFNSLKCKFIDVNGEQVTRPLTFEGEALGKPLVEWFAAANVEHSDKLRRELDQIATVLRNHDFLRLPGVVRGEDVFAGAPGVSSQLSSSSVNNLLPYRSVDTVSRVGPARDPLILPLLMAGWIAIWLVVIALVLWLKRERRIPAAHAPTMSAMLVFEGTFS